MKFADFICFDAIIAELKAVDRDGVIAELVTALAEAGKLKGCKQRDVIKAVIDRENEASTGIGKCVAVPHVKLAGIEDFFAAVGNSSTGIDFSSLDKQPVHSVILLVSPTDKVDKHLQVMERIFKYLQQENFRRFLRQSESIEQIKDLFIEADEKPSF